jgi:biotin transport system substrate-specific component
MQTLFVFLAGSLLGGVLGAMSQVVYILLGVIGLPVFAGARPGRASSSVRPEDT